MAREVARSRSPPAGLKAAQQDWGVPVEDDIAEAHALRTAYSPPLQSKFRVAALLRFTRPDASVSSISAVNAEPHDANIRGAICAERAAMCRFQREEAAKGSRVVRVICATDADAPIFPGPLCREFLTATCKPDTQIVAAGAAGSWTSQPLGELLLLPSLYRSGDQDTRPLCSAVEDTRPLNSWFRGDTFAACCPGHGGGRQWTPAVEDSMLALGKKLGAQVVPPADASLAAAYAAAVAHARRQKAQVAIFPITFAAAVCFSDGRVYSAAELKGIEYGCTVDAVSLVLPEMLRARDAGEPAPKCVVQADQFGMAHAPFAGARSLLLEHGFGDVQVSAHDDEGQWAACITVRESLPFSNFTEMFT